jgi:hypothetical protein
MSFGSEFSVDDVIKSEPFHGEWTAMIGGNDISQAVPVIDRAANILRGKGNDFMTVMSGFKQAYQEHRRDNITDQYLSSYDMTIKEFKRNGRKLLNPEIHASLSFQIREFRLGCAFLVYGYDNKKQPHIFEVRNPGIATIHDKPGFWAIGAGASSALNMLSTLGQGRELTRLAPTIYNVLAAKYFSESASDVGKKTFFVIHEFGSIGFSTSGIHLEPSIRTLWEENRPKTPPSMGQLVESANISFFSKRKNIPKPSASKTSRPMGEGGSD